MHGQGSLEYLIVIGTAIAIVSVIILLAVNYFSAQNSQYSYSLCREAASTCKLSLSANPSDQCVTCNNACNYSNGTELFSGAVNCCKVGNPESIYGGSPGCA